MNRDLLKRIPAVDSILRNEEMSDLITVNGRRSVADAVRDVLEEERKHIKESGAESYRFDMETFPEKVKARLEKSGISSLRRVVNATGVVLHTNLGRAPLAKAVMESIADTSMHYSNLEFNLEKGERGERHEHLEKTLSRLTGAESALVVNNNAAAVFLVLNTLAEGKDVIVSRGELIEIGGSFRIPDIMRKSGGRLVEVGTTNRTHLKDYEAAISGETALLLKVHKSNFEIAGFTSEVSGRDLAELGKRHGIPVMNDLGSGSIMDLSMFGLKKEPTVRDAVNSGVDIVAFSGDKLLGGPQAGIIVGKKEIIDSVKKNPLARTMRVDKMTISALGPTLRLYMDERKAVREIPILYLLARPVGELARTARKLAKGIRSLSAEKFAIATKDGYSQVGGGALPLQEIPTKLVAVRPKEFSTNRLERSMRMNRIPIIARIERDDLVLDMRTLMDGDLDIIIEFFKRGGQN